MDHPIKKLGQKIVSFLKWCVDFISALLKLKPLLIGLLALTGFGLGAYKNYLMEMVIPEQKQTETVPETKPAQPIPESRLRQIVRDELHKVDKYVNKSQCTCEERLREIVKKYHHEDLK